MAWEENSRICLHMQLIAFLSRIGVKIARQTGIPTTKSGIERKIGKMILKSIFGK